MSRPGTFANAAPNTWYVGHTSDEAAGANGTLVVRMAAIPECVDDEAMSQGDLLPARAVWDGVRSRAMRLARGVPGSWDVSCRSPDMQEEFVGEDAGFLADVFADDPAIAHDIDDELRPFVVADYPETEGQTP